MIEWFPFIWTISEHHHLPESTPFNWSNPLQPNQGTPFAAGLWWCWRWRRWRCWRWETHIACRYGWLPANIGPWICKANDFDMYPSSHNHGSGNDPIGKQTSLGATHFQLPWLWEEYYIITTPKRHTWNLKIPSWKASNIYKPPILGSMFVFWGVRCMYDLESQGVINQSKHRTGVSG